MIDHQQLRECIIRPVLVGLKLDSPVAEELLIATAAHESLGGTYLKEDHGPALGLYQMEPVTHDDIWSKFMPNHSEVTHRLMTTCQMSTKPLSSMLVFNLFYSTAMARIFYLRATAGLPATSDIDALWEYYKKFWNTEKGRAVKEDFIRNYFRFLNKETKDESTKQKRKV